MADLRCGSRLARLVEARILRRDGVARCSGGVLGRRERLLLARVRANTLTHAGRQFVAPAGQAIGESDGIGQFTCVPLLHPLAIGASHRVLFSRLVGTRGGVRRVGGGGFGSEQVLVHLVEVLVRRAARAIERGGRRPQIREFCAPAQRPRAGGRTRKPDGSTSIDKGCACVHRLYAAEQRLHPAPGRSFDGDLGGECPRRVRAVVRGVRIER